MAKKVDTEGNSVTAQRTDLANRIRSHAGLRNRKSSYLTLIELLKISEYMDMEIAPTQRKGR